MLDKIFNTLPQNYSAGSISTPLSIYFSIDEVKKTVFLDPQQCRVEEGKTLDNADCVCKTSEAFFLKVWNEGYEPGMKDFLSGAIKSNNPAILKSFLTACGK
ncbi:MAG: hypothetical protein JXQ81_11420 [Desulfuromonadales bacterium]|nr:hypothetical protein [Desulfuromonadales bacterium]MBN2793108.1 hypothetical protein [Desulfuromonadales bacterium]